jgi:hypothetical protein
VTAYARPEDVQDCRGIGEKDERMHELDRDDEVASRGRTRLEHSHDDTQKHVVRGLTERWMDVAPASRKPTQTYLASRVSWVEKQ